MDTTFKWILYLKTIKNANIRNKPFVSNNTLVKQVAKNSNLTAIALLDNGWYLLNDGNIVLIIRVFKF